MHFFNYLLTLNVLLLIAIVIIVSATNPEFKLNSGTIKGKYLSTFKKRSISSFTSIPYAKPPVDDLRFQAPQPTEKWNNTLDATKQLKRCPQLIDGIVVGVEDCLYLNVYTPKLTDVETTIYPVMIYIFGGAFLAGSAEIELYGPGILLDKNVVLVSFNYRLGPLGFLTTGDFIVPGNNGLKDQHLVIKWVKENIRYFGGNPNKITVFGHSSGGASVHLHMLSPLNKDYIHGVIFQSGTALSPWSFDINNQVLQNSKKLAKYLNCSIVSSLDMINCLKNVSVEYLIKSVHPALKIWYSEPAVPFRPVIEPDIDGAFITQNPVDIIKSGKALNIPAITGISTQDGAFKVSEIFGNQKHATEFQQNFTYLAPLCLGYINSETDYSDIANEIKRRYFIEKKISNDTRVKFVQMFTDRLFLLPANTAVDLHVQYTNAPVYYYKFGYRGTRSYCAFHGDRKHDYGVCLGDILLYLFEDKMSFPFPMWSPSDLKMIEAISTFWINFATYGDPTPVSHSWAAANKNGTIYYVIQNENDMHMEENMHSKKLLFWETLVKDKYIHLPIYLSNACGIEVYQFTVVFLAILYFI